MWSRDGARQRGGQGRVDLDRQHPRAGLEQPQGQRAEPGSDLDDDFVGADAGKPHDPPHGVGVHDEVLAPALGRTHIERLGQLPDRPGAEELRVGALVCVTPPSVPSAEEQRTTDRPLPGTGPLVEHLGPVGLLVRRRIDRVARSTDRRPGRQRELVEPVVAGGVHRARVAPGLARSQRTPVQSLGAGRRRREGTNLGAVDARSGEPAGESPGGRADAAGPSPRRAERRENDHPAAVATALHGLLDALVARRIGSAQDRMVDGEGSAHGAGVNSRDDDLHPGLDLAAETNVHQVVGTESDAGLAQQGGHRLARS